MKEFTVTENHIKLLRKAYVGWEDCEYGAPSIDCKRPYGNSDVPDDIRDILANPSLTNIEVRELHEGTKTALQILLRYGEFKAGVYSADDYRQNWELEESNNET